MRFGLLSYCTTNLGDEIQSIAAEQFLPSVVFLVDRDALNRPPAGARNGRIVLNGWHTHRPENWPPAETLETLLVSFHITNEISRENVRRLNPVETLLRGKRLAYFREHGPVGARDVWTRDLLLAKKVSAYFSGCLTLTLGTGRRATPHDYICAVDLDRQLLNRLCKRAKSRVVPLTHEDPVTAGFAERSARARRLLSIYARAKCVVTNRLHCALPCLALGTPVLFVVTARDTYRFSGLVDLLRHCSREEFLTGKAKFNPDNPPPNHGEHLPLRRELIRTVNRFIGGRAAQRKAPLHPFKPEPQPESLIAMEQKLQPRPRRFGFADPKRAR